MPFMEQGAIMFYISGESVQCAMLIVLDCGDLSLIKQ